MNIKNIFSKFYFFSKLISLLLSIRVFNLVFLAITLYSSIFAFFANGLTIKNILWEVKIHGIVLCVLLSVASGSLINQFYDKEKDKIGFPIRYKIQRFIKDKHILYLYLLLNFLSLLISFSLSIRIFLFFIVYQFCIWFYSHKLSKVLIVNNLFYVFISLYPFLGMMIYFKKYTLEIFELGIILFFLLLLIDIMKDILTNKVDKILNYETIPIVFGWLNTKKILHGIMGVICIFSYLLLISLPSNQFLITIYFKSLICFFIILIFLKINIKNILLIINMIRFFIFIGVIFILINGLFWYHI